jgi:hypothetical protein
MDAPTLEYARPQRQNPSRVLRNVALAASLSATPVLAISLAMYYRLNPTFRTVQLGLAWSSMALGAVGLLASAVAWARNRRGRGEIVAVLASLVYSVALYAAFEYD